MMNEVGLVFSGPKTQPEAELWIQNMENHFRSNLVSRKNEVSYALKYFEGSAATWWQMHQAIQGWNGAKTCKNSRRLSQDLVLSGSTMITRRRNLVHARFAEK